MPLPPIPLAHLVGPPDPARRGRLLAFLRCRLRRPLVRIEGIAPARRSRYVPVVLSPREVKLLLRALSGPARLAAALMYGSGLRLMECLTLRVKDIDFDRREIVVRGGKGGNDRRVPLADGCVRGVRRQLGTREWTGAIC